MRNVWLVALACACGRGGSEAPAAGSAAPAAAGSAAEAIPPPLTRAAQIIEALSKHDFHSVFATFSPTVANGLPEPQLAALWSNVEQQIGPLSACDAPAKTSSDPIVVTATCRFAKTTLDLVLAFDKQGQVAGLHLPPHKAAAPPWSPPAYAATDAVARDMAVGDLPGTLTLPAGKGPWPAIVLVQGSGPHDRDETVGPNKPFADLAAGLAAEGIATLRYDKRTKVHPETLPKQFTVDDEVTNDALVAIDAVRAAPEIDGKRVYVLGHSLGAYLAPRIGSRAKGLAGIVVLAGPTRDFADLVVAQVTYLQAGSDAIAHAKTEATRIHELAAGAAPQPGEMHIGAPAAYWKDLKGFDAPGIAASLAMRVFVGQGGRDYQVSATLDYPAWQKALDKKPNATLVVWPALNHLLIAGEGDSKPAEYETPGHVDKQVIGDIAAFVKRA